jgi:hypothetical protein
MFLEKRRRSMGTLLDHNPWVYIYLLLVGSMFLAVLWDGLHSPSPPRRGSRTPQNQTGEAFASGGAIDHSDFFATITLTGRTIVNNTVKSGSTTTLSVSGGGVWIPQQDRL